MSIKAFLFGKKIDKLEYTNNDLNGMKNALIYCGAERESIFICNKGNKIEFLEKYYEFIKTLNYNDTAIVYFSGHAINTSGKLKMKIDNSRYNSFNYILMSDIEPYLSESASSKRLVIFDCCNAESAIEDFPKFDTEKYLLFTSSSRLEKYSYEIKELGGSFFTSHLINLLTKNQINVINEKNEIIVRKLCDEIKKQVKLYNYENNTEIPTPKLYGDAGNEFAICCVNQKNSYKKANCNVNWEFVKIEEGDIPLKIVKGYYEGKPVKWNILKKYTFTRDIYQVIVDSFNKENIAIIVGAGGEGKTTLMKQLGVYFFERNYTVLNYNNKDDIFDMPRVSKNHIYLIPTFLFPV